MLDADDAVRDMLDDNEADPAPTTPPLLSAVASPNPYELTPANARPPPRTGIGLPGRATVSSAGPEKPPSSPSTSDSSLDEGSNMVGRNWTAKNDDRCRRRATSLAEIDHLDHTHTHTHTRLRRCDASGVSQAMTNTALALAAAAASDLLAAACMAARRPRSLIFIRITCDSDGATT